MFIDPSGLTQEDADTYAAWSFRPMHNSRGSAAGPHFYSDKNELAKAQKAWDDRYNELLGRPPLNPAKYVTQTLGDKLTLRSEWGGTAKDSNWVSDPNKTDIVIHHTGGFTDTITSVDATHNASFGGGIGYHFLVDAEGKIYEGRPLDMRGTHVAGANTGKIGVSLVGDFREDNKPTDIQLASMQMLVGVLQNAYSIQNTSVSGHSDINNTECPGQNLYDIMLRYYR